MDRNDTPKGILIWLPVLLSIMLVIGMMLGMGLQAVPASSAVVHSKDGLSGIGNGRVEELIRYIEAKYVDEVNSEELIQEAINHMLGQLDPHSNYLTKEQVERVSEQLEGNFEGIGVEFMVLDDTIVVISPLAEGPADKAGIRAGDRIVTVEETIVAGVNMESEAITSQLKGKKGTEVRVGILRPGEGELREFTIIRDEIPVFSVDAHYMLDEKTGYIKVNRFSATTYEEFMRAVEDMVENHQMEDLIIDLRQNPGGYLREATEILSQLFSQKGLLLVYTEGRSVKRQEYNSTGRPFFSLEDLVVLIDEGSASASEILAGAIQDHDRGSLVGRRSFGKGLVQEQYRLSDGSALRLTVARYYTPSGRLIQKSYQDKDAYERDVFHRFESGELLSRDSIAQSDSTEFLTDNGRVVYGGGGITPDFFVPLDTLLFNDTYISLNSYIPQFVLKNLSSILSPVKEMTLETYRATGLKEALFQQFLDYAKAEGAHLDEEDMALVSAPLRQNLKARIAKHLFDNDAFYELLQLNDPDIAKGLEVLGMQNPLTSRN